MPGLFCFGMVLCAIFCACLSASAQVAPKVDSFIADYMKKNHIPGLSLAVLKEGKIVLAKGYGLANVETMHRASAESVYQLASVTKQFTATLTMMLVEEKKIGLDNKITEYLPDLPKAWGEVTVRQLLNHTSEIYSYTSLPEFFENGNSRRELNMKRIVEMVGNKPLDFAPGTDWRYNNTGYYLLGGILEKVSGKKYGDLLAERIFKPLGMQKTRLNDMRAIVPNRVVGYSWNGSTLLNGEYVSPSQPYSAGAMLSTVLDMAKWDAALYGEKLLKRKTLQEMWTSTPLPTKQPFGYGFGWMLSEKNKHRVIEHGGGIDGFSTHIARFVDDKLTVIALLNLDSGNAERVAMKVAEIVLPALVSAPLQALQDPDPALTKRLKEVATEATQGRANSNEFDPETAKLIIPRIQEGRQTFAAFGAMQSFVLVERKENEGNLQLRYRVKFEKFLAGMVFVLNKEKKIVGMLIRPEE
jgi:CubicO group peptidase (beta-lactamase class C family)